MYIYISNKHTVTYLLLESQEIFFVHFWWRFFHCHRGLLDEGILQGLCLPWDHPRTSKTQRIPVWKKETLFQKTQKPFQTKKNTKKSLETIETIETIETRGFRWSSPFHQVVKYPRFMSKTRWKRFCRFWVHPEAIMKTVREVVLFRWSSKPIGCGSSSPNLLVGEDMNEAFWMYPVPGWMIIFLHIS